MIRSVLVLRCFTLLVSLVFPEFTILAVVLGR